jgi:hypothetical protein
MDICNARRDRTFPQKTAEKFVQDESSRGH